MGIRAILLRAPESFLEERRRHGHDDEMWDGVLHMTPPPPAEHGAALATLERALAATGRGAVQRSPRIRAADRDYRIPDLAVTDGDGQIVIVVEILAPGDESRDKVPWYAAQGIGEVWLVDPTTMAIEVVST